MRMDWKTRLKSFLLEESGQTTTEYILMLVVVVTIFMKFRTKLTGIINTLFGGLEGGVQNAVGTMNEGGGDF